ncbi:MAG: hypothetical protein QNJ22_14340 [Desulfosarcinaceae bacterium]|nr:hypothetical protein [Desulfosarcinaceae bacterium]
MMALRIWMGLTGLICLAAGALAATHTDPARLAPGQPHLRIQLVYNYAVYTRPFFFKPKSRPSFGIWIRERDSGRTLPVFVTRKAGLDKWTFTAKRPEAIPVWYGIRDGQSAEPKGDIDAISAATPKGEMATIYWEIPPTFQDRSLEIYIEANNSFDFNPHYSREKGAPHYSAANGQPSLVWRAVVDPNADKKAPVTAQLVGHGELFGRTHHIYSDLGKITTAAHTFRNIQIELLR